MQKPMSLFSQGARYTYIEGGLKQRYWVRICAAGGCTHCSESLGTHIVHNSERRGEGWMRMGNSMKPAGAKACVCSRSNRDVQLRDRDRDRESERARNPVPY